MTTYQDLWDSHKATEDLDNTLQGLYNEHTGENDGDPDDEVTPADLEKLRAHLSDMRSVMQDIETEEITVDDIAEARRAEALSECDAIEEDYKDQSDDVAVGARAAILRVRTRVTNTVEPDDCVRIALHIPAAHLSAEQREKLEKDVVQEAAIYSKMWMDALEFGGESVVMNQTPAAENIVVIEEDDEEGEEVEVAVSDVEMPPDDVLKDIARKWSETYEQMRADFNEDFEALEIAVVECLIEDGYITPGSEYNVETHTVETYGGDKTTFVTGPQGSKTVKKDKS